MTLPTPPRLTARITWNVWLLVCLIFLTSCGPKPPGNAVELVKKGQPQAEIVVVENPPRMTALAVEELQTHLEKISGARLPVVHSPSGEMPVQVYVGRSDSTEALGIATDDLEDGAFRIVSGENWLALVGKDEDYVPPGPHSLQPSTHEEHVPMMQEWDLLTGGTYFNPVGSRMWRSFNRSEGWFQQDQRGSLNAVYEFLRGLGVRWYMPGELGEIIPKTDTVTFLSNESREVQPDFPVRHMAFAGFSSSPREDILWYLRQGLSHHSTVLGNFNTHGLRDVLARKEIQQDHPEYFALVSGKRVSDMQQKNQACLSSEGLFEETLRYARGVFDVYNEPVVSIMPPDGMRFCECELCKGKDRPDRGSEGIHSDYVWEFVNRVAAELQKSHPDKKVICYSYGTYTLPPEAIDKLSPNLMVGIVHGRSASRDPEKQAELRRQWMEKSSQPLTMWEHYPFTHRGTFLPVYFPKRIATGLQELKSVSVGDFVETAIGPAAVRGHGLHAPEFNHLNVYVTSRFLWDADQDLDAMLGEYYDLFYGPAAPEMKAFTDYCEANWLAMKGNVESIDRALALLNAAMKKAPAGSPYADRLELLSNHFAPLRKHRELVGQTRENVPEARVVVVGRGPVPTIDGKLDEAEWEKLPAFALKNNHDGSPAALKTNFKLLWTGGKVGGNLLVGIYCESPPPSDGDSFGTKDGDPAILDGETVELLIETPSHSYYQIAINPAGHQIDADHQGGNRDPGWSSQAEVATHIGDGYWTAEIRIPIAGEDVPADPLHGIAGRRPTPELPWHMNVIRNKPSPDPAQKTTWAWSPTESSNTHEVSKFGRVQCRR